MEHQESETPVRGRTASKANGLFQPQGGPTLSTPSSCPPIGLPIPSVLRCKFYYHSSMRRPADGSGGQLTADKRMC